jgi:hypothetical protein
LNGETRTWRNRIRNAIIAHQPTRSHPSRQRGWSIRYGHPEFLPVAKKPAKFKTLKAQKATAGVEDKVARKPAIAFVRDKKRRESERRREEAKKETERERRKHAIAKAQAALESARARHNERKRQIESDREALDKKATAEDARWEAEKEKLERALRRAWE